MRRVSAFKEGDAPAAPTPAAPAAPAAKKEVNHVELVKEEIGELCVNDPSFDSF